MNIPKDYHMIMLFEQSDLKAQMCDRGKFYSYGCIFGNRFDENLKDRLDRIYLDQSITRQFPCVVALIRDMLILIDLLRDKGFPRNKSRINNQWTMSLSETYVDRIQEAYLDILKADRDSELSDTMDVMHQIGRELGDYRVDNPVCDVSEKLQSDCDELLNAACSGPGCGQNLDIMICLYIALNSLYKYEFEELLDPKGFHDRN
jgi:hypothetical protein